MMCKCVWHYLVTWSAFCWSHATFGSFISWAMIWYSNLAEARAACTCIARYYCRNVPFVVMEKPIHKHLLVQQKTGQQCMTLHPHLFLQWSLTCESQPQIHSRLGTRCLASLYFLFFQRCVCHFRSFLLDERCLWSGTWLLPFLVPTSPVCSYWLGATHPLLKGCSP